MVIIDGPIHEQLKDYDKDRDICMQAAGYQVLQFSNSQVEENPEVVLNPKSGICSKWIGAAEG